MKGLQCHKDGDHGVSSLPSLTLSPCTDEPDNLLTLSSSVHVALADWLACRHSETSGIRDCVWQCLVTMDEENLSRLLISMQRETTGYQQGNKDD